MFKKWTLYNAAPKEFKKYILWFWRLVFGGLTFLVLIFLLAGLGVFGKMPTFERLENPESNLATQIIVQKMNVFVSIRVLILKGRCVPC